MFNRAYPLVLLVGSIFFTSAAQADSIYNFDGDTSGTTTPFTDLSSEVYATFSGQVPNAFIVEPVGVPNPYAGLSGNILAENGAAGVTNQALTISLNNLNFSGIVFNFVVDATTPTPLNLSSYFNGTLVGTGTATEPVPTGNRLPEGVMDFYINDQYVPPGRPFTFNSLVISTAASGFAVDNLDIMPEPGSFSLVGVVLSAAALVLLLRRKARLQ